MRRLLILLFLFGTGTLKAADTLVLRQVLDIALRNNYDIRLAENRVDYNDALNSYGVAGGLPSINGSGNYQVGNTDIVQRFSTIDTTIARKGALSETVSGTIAGTIILFNGFRVIAVKHRLEELEQQSRDQLNLQIQNSLAEVLSAYYDVVQQQDYLDVLNQSVALSQLQVDLVKARQAAGYANNADLFQSQIDLNTRVQERETQKLTIIQSKADLLKLMQVPADTAIEIGDTIIVREDIRLPEVLDRISEHPEVSVAQEQILINRNLQRETASQRLPVLRLNSGYLFNRTNSTAGQILLNQSTGPYVGLGLVVPIYNGGSVLRQERAARINTDAAKLNLDNILLDYQTNAIKNFESYRNNLGQARTQDSTYRLSRELVDLSLKRFELSSATILELKESQQSFLDAGYRLTTLRYAAKLAEIELMRISNRLSNESR